jgi:catechol 2,3-dioxygenase-like lactoylglutathione lyase family enzyme
MSPTKRITKKTVHKPVKRAAPKPVKRVARKPARKPALPPRLNTTFRDLNVVYYYVTDLARARKFYSETLGLPIAAEVPGIEWIEFGLPNQTHLALNTWQDRATMPPAVGGATVTFGVDDARGVIAALRAKGVRCDEVDEISGMVVIGTFYDPDGNRLQIAQTLL